MGVSARFVCSCFRKSMSAHSLSGDQGPWSTTALFVGSSGLAFDISLQHDWGPRRNHHSRCISSGVRGDML